MKLNVQISTSHDIVLKSSTFFWILALVILIIIWLIPTCLSSLSLIIAFILLALLSFFLLVLLILSNLFLSVVYVVIITLRLINKLLATILINLRCFLFLSNSVHIRLIILTCRLVLGFLLEHFALIFFPAFILPLLVINKFLDFTVLHSSNFVLFLLFPGGYLSLSAARGILLLESST